MLNSMAQNRFVFLFFQIIQFSKSPPFKMSKQNCFDIISMNSTAPADWAIHRLHLCRGVRHPCHEGPAYDIKQSDGEVSMMLEFGECGAPLHCHHSQVHSGPV